MQVEEVDEEVEDCAEYVAGKKDIKTDEFPNKEEITIIRH